MWYSHAMTCLPPPFRPYPTSIPSLSHLLPTVSHQSASYQVHCLLLSPCSPTGPVRSARVVPTCSGLSRLPPLAPQLPVFLYTVLPSLCWSSCFSLPKNWQFRSFSQSVAILSSLYVACASLNLSPIPPAPVRCRTSSFVLCSSDLLSVVIVDRNKP